MLRAPLLALALALACSPKAEPPRTPAGPTAPDAGPPPSAAADAGVTPLPEVRLPARVELGSQHVTRREHPEWASCRSEPAPDPNAALRALATKCAPALRLRPAAETLEASASASDPSKTLAFSAEAGRCYRVVAAAAASVGALVVVARDEEGRPIAAFDKDELASAIEPTAALCFRDAQRATLSAAVGRGQGAFAVTIWHD